MRIKRDIINKFKEWKDAENPCRGKGRKLCQWKKYCCVQRTLPTQEPHTFLVSQFTAKLRNVSLSLALSGVGCEMVAQIIISYSRDTYRLFSFFYRQRQCKSNTMKFLQLLRCRRDSASRMQWSPFNCWGAACLIQISCSNRYVLKNIRRDFVQCRL